MALGSFLLQENNFSNNQYKIQNRNLFVILEYSKTWQHFLEIDKYEVFIFVNPNNIYKLIDTNNLSLIQIEQV